MHQIYRAGAWLVESFATKFKNGLEFVKRTWTDGLSWSAIVESIKQACADAVSFLSELPRMVIDVAKNVMKSAFESLHDLASSVPSAIANFVQGDVAQELNVCAPWPPGLDCSKWFSCRDAIYHDPDPSPNPDPHALVTRTARWFTCRIF